MEDAIEHNQIEMTGSQVRFVRHLLEENQVEFAKRFATSQAAIIRIERKRDDKHSGPLIILIDLLAKELGIEVPDLSAIPSRRRQKAAAADVAPIPTE